MIGDRSRHVRDQRKSLHKCKEHVAFDSGLRRCQRPAREWLALVAIPPGRIITPGGPLRYANASAKLVRAWGLGLRTFFLEFGRSCCRWPSRRCSIRRPSPRTGAGSNGRTPREPASRSEQSVSPPPLRRKSAAGRSSDCICGSASPRTAQGLNFAVSAPDVRAFLADIGSGRLSNLTLQIPNGPPGCLGQIVFNGRTKSNDAGLRTYSLRCDSKVDSWEVFPDDKSKPLEFHLDPDRVGESAIVVFSDAKREKWETSLWDFFRDKTFAVVGHHDDGRIQPTRFEFART
jgi:hypothetical protein